MKTAANRVVSPSTGASMTRSARFSPVGGRAIGLFSICTRIGTRSASAGSESWVPFIGHTATGVGDGDGLGEAVGEGVGRGVGDGVGDGVGGSGRWRRLGGAGQHDGAGGDEDGNEDEAAHGEQPGT